MVILKAIKGVSKNSAKRKGIEQLKGDYFSGDFSLSLRGKGGWKGEEVKTGFKKET